MTISPTVLMCATFAYGGVVPGTPSGTDYAASVGDVIAVLLEDQSFMERLGFVTVMGYDAGGGGGAHVRGVISHAQLETMGTSPVELIPPQGAGLTTIVTRAVFQYKGIGIAFPGGSPPAVVLQWTAFPDAAILQYDINGNGDIGINFEGGSWLITPTAGSDYKLNMGGSDVSNSAVSLATFGFNSGTPENPGVWGPLASASVNTPGTDYAPGDTGQVITNSDDLTLYTVLTIDGSGGALTLDVSPQGVVYTNTTGAVTTTDNPQPGSGTGLTVDLIVDPPGTWRGSITYDLWYITVKSIVP